MRSKENAQDYRYFPEPDIPPIVITEETVEQAMLSMPDFMNAKIRRFTEQYELPEDEAAMLASSKKEADFYEALVAEGTAPKTAANWLIEHVSRILREEETEYEAVDLSAEELAKLIAFVEGGNVNRKDGLKILEQMVKGCGPEDVERYIQEQQLTVSTDTSELAGIIEQVLKEHPDTVAEYLVGKEKVLGFLVGQVMRSTRGKYNPGVVNETLLAKLKSMKH